MPLSQKFNESFKSFSDNLNSFKDTLILEAHHNKDDIEALALLSKFDVLINGTRERINRILELSRTFKPDQFVCTCLRNHIEPNCVFDDEKVICDKKDDSGATINKKEDCPHWVKFGEINKQK